MKASQFVQGLFQFMSQDGGLSKETAISLYTEMENQLPGIVFSVCNPNHPSTWDLAKAPNMDWYLFTNGAFYDKEEDWCDFQFINGRVRSPEDWEKADKMFGEFFHFLGEYTLIKQGSAEVFHVYQGYKYLGKISSQLSAEETLNNFLN